MIVFAVAAKTDAERWRGWAWPLMGGAILLMLLTILPFTESLAPRIHGSRRFLRGSSLQPSELAKLAVVVWTAMLVVKKGEAMRRLTKGVLPAIVVVGMMAILAALEPDLSAAVYFLLLMGIVMFAGGARIGHFVALGIIGTGLLAVPVLAGSAAYAASEVFGWKEGLDRKPMQAKAFYGVIAVAGAGGVLLSTIGINPMKALYWSAVLNGLLAPPLMVLVMLLARDRAVMGELRISLPLATMGWLATAVMGGVAALFLFA